LVPLLLVKSFFRRTEYATHSPEMVSDFVDAFCSKWLCSKHTDPASSNRHPTPPTNDDLDSPDSDCSPADGDCNHHDNAVPTDRCADPYGDLDTTYLDTRTGNRNRACKCLCCQDCSSCIHSYSAQGMSKRRKYSKGL